MKNTEQKIAIHQVTTMLATTKNVLFPGHNHVCWWLDTLIISQVPVRVINKVLGPQHR